MIQNIFVGLMAAAMIAVGVWGWWLENGRPEKQEDSNEEIGAENMEDCNCNWKNKKVGE